MIDETHKETDYFAHLIYANKNAIKFIHCLIGKNVSHVFFFQFGKTPYSVNFRPMCR